MRLKSLHLFEVEGSLSWSSAALFSDTIPPVLLCWSDLMV